MLYGSFSMIFGALFSLIFFKCGWSNAEKGIGVIKAFKEYQAERKQLVEKEINRINKAKSNTISKTKLNTKATRRKLKPPSNVSYSNYNKNRQNDSNSSTSTSTSKNIETMRLTSKILTNSNSNTPDSSNRNIMTTQESDYDSDGISIKTEDTRINMTDTNDTANDTNDERVTDENENENETDGIDTENTPVE